MARIDWALLCDRAFLDNQNRLCLIGVFRDVPVSQLPRSLDQVMLVARLADIKPIDEVDITVGMVSPSGAHEARMGSKRVMIEMVGEYVVATLRHVPLIEEGIHRFQIRLRGQPIVPVDVSVVVAVPASIGVQ